MAAEAVFCSGRRRSRRWRRLERTRQRVAAVQRGEHAECPVCGRSWTVVQAVGRAKGRVSTLPLRFLAVTAALYGRSAIAHTSNTNRSPSGARETQGSMAPSARSVAVSRRSR